MNIETIVSTDGTTIAFERTGEGPAVVLVGGAFCDRTASVSGTPLAAQLAHRFTVYSYDRRGRGDSTDAAVYTLEREQDDLAAVIDVAGGSAHVFGNSSGALLALDAAARGVAIPRLALYEPPVILDPDRMAALTALAQELDLAAAAGRRGDAVELYFTKVMAMPEAAVQGMKKSSHWRGLEALAHTLGYDLRITARGASRLAMLSTVAADTRIIQGSASPSWFRDALQVLTDRLPRATLHTLAGQTHAVDPATLARELEAFFTA